jgi:hypothetical protein
MRDLEGRQTLYPRSALCFWSGASKKGAMNDEPEAESPFMPRGSRAARWATSKASLPPHVGGELPPRNRDPCWPEPDPQMSADGIRECAVFLHLRTSATSADSWLLAGLARVHGKIRSDEPEGERPFMPRGSRAARWKTSQTDQNKKARSCGPFVLVGGLGLLRTSMCFTPVGPPSISLETRCLMFKFAPSEFSRTQGA